MKDDPAEILLKRPRKAPKAPNPVSDDYLAQLLVPPNDTDEDLGFLRSAIVIGLIAETGIRLKELSRLKRCDIDILRGEISIRSWNSGFTCGSKREPPISDTLTRRLRLSFESSGSDGSPVLPYIPEEPDLASLSLQREIRNAQIRAGLTARHCGIEKRDPNAPAFSFRDFRATSFETWRQCGLQQNKVTLLLGRQIAWIDRPICWSSTTLSAEERQRIRDRLEARYRGSAWLGD